MRGLDRLRLVQLIHPLLLLQVLFALQQKDTAGPAEDRNADDHTRQAQAGLQQTTKKIGHVVTLGKGKKYCIGFQITRKRLTCRVVVCSSDSSFMLAHCKQKQPAP